MPKDIVQQIRDHLAVEGQVPNELTRKILLRAGEVIEELRKGSEVRTSSTPKTWEVTE